MEEKKFMLPKKINYFLEGLCICFLILSFVVTFAVMSSLPETIPNHFDASGTPNGWGNKSSLVTLPFMTLVFYIVLSLSQRSKNNDFLSIFVTKIELVIMFSLLQCFALLAASEVVLPGLLGYLPVIVFLLGVATVIATTFFLSRREKMERTPKP